MCRVSKAQRNGHGFNCLCLSRASGVSLHPHIVIYDTLVNNSHLCISLFLFSPVPISKIREVREGEKDFSKKLNSVDVSLEVTMSSRCH